MKKLVAGAIALVSVVALIAGVGAATTAKAVKDMGVVLIINTNLGDKSFCDLSNEGLLAAAKEFGFRAKVVELGGDTTKQIPTLTEFAESKDWDLIVCGTYNIRESFQAVAQQFPDKKFILYDAKDDKSLPNVYSVEHLQNEGSFIAGAAAALLTSSKAPLANSKKIIGFVAGGENTSINDFLVGYIQGAQSVDPAVKVLISYVGNFKDTAKAKEMAIAQINQGADVVFQVAGGAGLGVLDACKDKNVYAIGVDSDQAMVLESSRPDLSKIIATSMQKKVNKTVYNAIKGALDGTLPWGKYETVGLKQGSIGIAKNKYFDAIFTAAQKKQLEDLEAKVASGKIKVQTAIGMDNDTINKIRDSVRP
jgi:basic membrane protein A